MPATARTAVTREQRWQHRPAAQEHASRPLALLTYVSLGVTGQWFLGGQSRPPAPRTSPSGAAGHTGSAHGVRSTGRPDAGKTVTSRPPTV